jgi:hypothetical protein
MLRTSQVVFNIMMKSKRLSPSYHQKENIETNWPKIRRYANENCRHSKGLMKEKSDSDVVSTHPTSFLLSHGGIQSQRSYSRGKAAESICSSQYLITFPLYG